MNEISGITFIVDGNPLSQNAVYKRGRGNRLYMTDEGKGWKEHIRWLAALAFKPPWQTKGKKTVQLLFFFDSERPDLDGPLKLILDAMQGWAYINDRQVDGLILRKRLDKEKPRAEITVWQSTEN